MNLKKSIFSYIVLAVFAVFCALSLVFTFETTGITKMLGFSPAGMICAVCGYLLLSIAVFMALRTICAEISRHISNPQKLESLLSVILPILILTGIVTYLVLYLVYHTPLALENDRFYRQALVSSQKGVSFVLHGASFLYIRLLHGMLLLFGNTPFAGIVLQIVLFFLALLLLYLGMRDFAGVLPAAASMAALGFLPVSMRYVFSLTPELLYLTFYFIGFYLAGAAHRRFYQEKIHFSLQCVLFFLTGLFIGFLVYLDLYGISLYFFFALLISVENCVSASNMKRRRAAVSNILVLLGGVSGFLSFVFIASSIGNIPFLSCLDNLFKLYFPQTDFQSVLSEGVALLPDITPGGSILLITPAFFLVPAFFLQKQGQHSAFILHLLFIYGLRLFSVSCINSQLMITFAWSALAGIGLYGLVRPSDKAVGAQAKGSASETQESAKGPKENASSENVPSENGAEKKKEQESPAPGEPLYNPLSVPKKKKRSTPDFAYPVEESAMKFDVEVADDDDFDI